ncbi:MAG: Wzz/FepE/Etk N-terminal domain-containing protein [Vibrionaceae bacterium]
MTSAPNFSSGSDDEIDLVELFSVLWKKKWWIVTTIAIFLAAAATYLHITPPKYKVSAPYQTQTFSVLAMQLCPNEACLKDSTLTAVAQNLVKAQAQDEFAQGSWQYVAKGNRFEFTSYSLKAKELFVAQLERAAEVTAQEILANAKTELSLLQIGLHAATLGTERVATNHLNAKRVIRMLEKGQPLIAAADDIEVTTTPKSALILVLAALLGSMVSCMAILLHHAVNKPKALFVPQLQNN